MNNDFKSYLQYKVLAHRFSADKLFLSGYVIDQTVNGLAMVPEGVDDDGNPIEISTLGDVKLQNVCAKMSVPLVRRMEGTLRILSMSKREFIEMAVINFLDETDRVIAENEQSIYDDEAFQEDERDAYWASKQGQEELQNGDAR